MIVISAGHGLKIRGASCDEPWGLDEVDEARRVVAEVANNLKLVGEEVEVVLDDVSTTQETNLKYITSHHNAFPAEGRLDVSVHFNAYTITEGARGTEVLYLTQSALADRVAAAIASASGLINRGSKYRSDLYFLNKTTGSEGAILIEVCFVDAHADTTAYRTWFNEICAAIGDMLAQQQDLGEAGEVPFHTVGAISWFGGPDDDGVAPDEGLAFISDVDQAPELFLPEQPPDTTGLARRLDSDNALYIAMRFDYDQWSKAELASGEINFLVRAPSTGKEVIARPADWGPASETGRVADGSLALLEQLGIETDDQVEITLAPPAVA